MNTAMLAADIARRVPEMARDCQENNAQLIERLILQELETDGWNQMNDAIREISQRFNNINSNPMMRPLTEEEAKEVLDALRDSPGTIYTTGGA